MVSPDTTAEPEAPMDVDPFSGATWCIDPPSRGSTPVAEWAVCRQISEVRTVCVTSASTDLCGGCRVTGIPTATHQIIATRVRNSEPSVDYLSPAILRALWPSIEEGCRIFTRMVSICL